MDDEPKKKIVDLWVREEQFSGRIDLDKVVDYVRSQKATGQLVFDIGQGSIQRARFVKKIPAEMIL